MTGMYWSSARFTAASSQSVSWARLAIRFAYFPRFASWPRNADYFDFESRYTRGETEYTCPPDDLTADELARVEAVALAAYEALDLSGYGRVDIVLDGDGVPQVLELESVPGMTDTSLLPIAASAAGMTLRRCSCGADCRRCGRG